MDEIIRELADRRPDFYIAYCENCEADRIIARDMELAPDRPTETVAQCPDCKLNCIREIFNRVLEQTEVE